MKKINKSPLATAMGAALISTVSATAVYADTNPFGMTELSTGYMQLAAAEMKCGAAMNMDNKTAEGACAGEMHPKKAEAKASDASCGAMMKGKEGACGQMKPGETMKGKEGACGSAK